MRGGFCREGSVVSKPDEVPASGTHILSGRTPQTRKPTNEEGCSNATPGDDGVSVTKGVGDRSWGQRQRWR